MAVPKRRKTRSRRDMRRSHDALIVRGFSVDKKTGQRHRRHCILPDGSYRGRIILPKT